MQWVTPGSPRMVTRNEVFVPKTRVQRGNAKALTTAKIRSAKPTVGQNECLIKDVKQPLFLRLKWSRATNVQDRKLFRYWLFEVDGKRVPLGKCYVAPRGVKDDDDAADLATLIDAAEVARLTELAKSSGITLGQARRLCIARLAEHRAGITAGGGRRKYSDMTLLEVVDQHIYQTGGLQAKGRQAVQLRRNTVVTYELYRDLFIKGTRFATMKPILMDEDDARSLVDTVLNQAGKSKSTPGAAAKLTNLCAAAIETARTTKNDRHFNPFAALKEKDDYIRGIVHTARKGRALETDEIRGVWTALNSPHGVGSPVTARALMLMLVTGQRSREVTGLHRTEIKQHDDGSVWWHLPPERQKNITIDTPPADRVEHQLYLTELALRIIGTEEQYGAWIFPNEQDPKKPMDARSAAHLVNRKRGNKSKPDPLAAVKWTPNDLRRTVETRLDEPLDCPKKYYNAILNHNKDDIAKLYNMNEYLEGKRVWLQRWSDYLEELIGPEHTAVIRHTDEPKYDIAMLRKLVADGISYCKIAKMKGFGVAESRIRQLCKEHNIKR